MNTVSHGGTSVYEGMEGRFDDLKSQKSEIGEMREGIKNNPNLSGDQKEAMLEDLDRAEASIDRALDYSTASGKYDTTSGNTRNDGDLAAVEAALGNAEASMNHVETQLAISAQSSQPVSGPSGAQGTSGASGPQGASSASSSASGSGGLGAMEFDGKNGSMTIDEMRTAMSEDPEALMSFLDGLGDEDRQMAMQMMMQRLQQINQMFSMMSNMMKSEHDTAKAAINNMRV
jgi:hypothetical protein